MLRPQALVNMKQMGFIYSERISVHSHKLSYFSLFDNAFGNKKIKIMHSAKKFQCYFFFFFLIKPMVKLFPVEIN